MTKLTKSGMAFHVSVTAGIKHEEAEKVVDELLSMIERSLLVGGTVVLKNIGTLSVKESKPRTVKGFGKSFETKGKRRAKFTLSRVLRDKMNTKVPIDVKSLFKE